MALVAYDNSDSSEYEDEEFECPLTITPENLEAKPPATLSDKLLLNGESTGVGPQSIFNLLPQPSSKKSVVIEEDDEFLHKKATVCNTPKPKAKITVPSLSDFKDVEDGVSNTKPKISNEKKSGLLSMLPQPKNSAISAATSLIPNVLKQKPANVKKKDLLPSPMKKAKVENKLTLEYSDESDNEEVQNDFFSINKPVELPTEELPLDIDDKSKDNTVKVPNQKLPRNIESYFKKDIVPEENVDTVTDYELSASSSQNDGYIAFEGNSDDVLNEEAILKLCGTRAKRRKEDIQIVDVNQQEVLDGAREMLLKGLMDDTSQRVSASKKKGNEPTTQQRRKHQITYLAHQAKANETELQNQWANNRMSKRKTQSKYGF